MPLTNDVVNLADRILGRVDEIRQAGTTVVWDVDPRAQSIRAFRADAPGRPVNFARGQSADAEPAVPAWRMAVDEVFT